MSAFLVIPTALIQVSGLADLDLLEHRLYWRLVGHIGSGMYLPDDASPSSGVTLRFQASDLLEPGEADTYRLAARLDTLSKIRVSANLDGRDKCTLWRFNMAFIAEHEIKDGEIEVFIGPKMFYAIKNRESFTRVREASLFAMRGTKYSSRLYVLIRDKANLKIPRWEVSIEEFRRLMQIKEGGYDSFDDLRKRVLVPSTSELNNESELEVSWKKGITFKNRVKTIVFEWKIRDMKELRKTAKEGARHSKAKNKSDGDGDAPPLVITARAARWLAEQPWDIRNEWWERARTLGAPDLAAATAIDNLAQWVNWVARLMVQDGLISDQP
jgi:hypothetical protein